MNKRTNIYGLEQELVRNTKSTDIGVHIREGQEGLSEEVSFKLRHEG